MEKLTYNCSYKPHGEVVFTELEEEQEAVLIHIETKMYYTLNKTGIEVWNMIQSSHSLEDMVAEFCNRYKIDRERSSQCVARIVNDLLNERLIEESE